MIDVELAAFFFMGNSVRLLSAIRAGQHTSNLPVASALIEAREGLKDFLQRAERLRIFPQTSEWARSILNTVISMVPDVPPGTMVQDHAVTQEEVDGLKYALQSFALMLSEESARAVVVLLQKQRTFDLHTLIESISTAFGDSVWERFSEFSKREIKEAGRCLALERYTASGFHMLRAVEMESRDCATLLSQARPGRRDFGDYLKILTQHGVDAKVVSVLDSVRAYERNPLVHPEDWLTQDDAVNIFCIAQAALCRLISCMESMKLFPVRNKV